MKKILLLGVTFILLLTGFLVIYLKYYGSDLVNLTRKKPSAETTTNQSDPLNTNSKPVDGIITQDQFSKSNMTYSSAFLGFSIPTALENSPTKVIVDNITYINKVLTVTLQQEQVCTPDRELPIQGAFYFSEDNVVTFYNVVNNSGVKDGQRCTARIVYGISNFEVDPTKNLSIKWQTESGEQTNFPICFYNGQPYNNNDVFASTAKCNTCSCSNGVVKCEVNNKCVDNEKKAAEAAAAAEQEKQLKSVPTPTPEDKQESDTK